MLRAFVLSPSYRLRRLLQVSRSKLFPSTRLRPFARGKPARKFVSAFRVIRGSHRSL